VPNDSTPATVVILAQLDAATTKEGFGILAEGVRRTGAAVTWVADGATLDRLADGGGEWGWALKLDRGEGDSRQGLRQHLKSLRHTAVDAVVADGGGIVHRDLLVEAGIHTAVVERFDDLPRGNRRPAPEGWACRSIVWGLWEVASTPARPGSLLGRLLPWAGGPVAGSLTIVTPPCAGAEVHAAADRVTRVIGAYRVGRQPARLVRLGDLPALLGSGCQPTGGSVLRAA